MRDVKTVKHHTLHLNMTALISSSR